MIYYGEVETLSASSILVVVVLVMIKVGVCCGRGMKVRTVDGVGDGKGLWPAWPSCVSALLVLRCKFQRMDP